MSGILGKIQARSIACPVPIWGQALPLSTAIGAASQRSGRDVVQGGMRAAGQNKGRHHEKNEPCTRHRVLDPHDPISLYVSFCSILVLVRTQEQIVIKVIPECRGNAWVYEFPL